MLFLLREKYSSFSVFVVVAVVVTAAVVAVVVTAAAAVAVVLSRGRYSWQVGDD